MSYLFIIKIYFTNKIDTICGGGQLLVSGSQSPISRVPSVRFPCLRIQGSEVTIPKVPVPGSKSPRSRVPGPESQGPGSQVLILDYALKVVAKYLHPLTKNEFSITDTLSFPDLLKNSSKN